MPYTHLEQNQLVMEVLSQLAKENNKSLARINRLLHVKQNAALLRRFWEILEDRLPGHPYSSVTRCTECGTFELVEYFS